MMKVKYATKRISESDTTTYILVVVVLLTIAIGAVNIFTM